jgi:hypothetical protein
MSFLSSSFLLSSSPSPSPPSFSFSFFSYPKSESRMAEQVIPGGLVLVGRERRGNDVGDWIWYKCCIHMYVNGKMISVETILGMEVEGVNSSMINCKNFCTCHNITPHSITIKKYYFS